MLFSNDTLYEGLFQIIIKYKLSNTIFFFKIRLIITIFCYNIYVL